MKTVKDVSGQTVKYVVGLDKNRVGWGTRLLFKGLRPSVVAEPAMVGG